MKIDSKYRLEEFPLQLRVVEAFDFREEPILLLEKDTIGNSFLSYLVESNGERELRVYLQVSNERLGLIIENEISITAAFSNAENNYVYIAEFALSNADILSSYMVPSSIFSLFNPIPSEYKIDADFVFNDVSLDGSELLNYSVRKQKLVFDFYLQSQNLVNSIKPYAFYKILIPIVEILKSMLEFDNRNADKYLAFSNLRQNSLGVTIEVNYSNDLFLEKETEVMEMIIQLLNAQVKEDFEYIVSHTKNDRYVKDYSKIIKAIIDNNACLHTAYANPITKKLLKSTLDREKAEIAKIILDESFEIIEDVEEIIGTFLEIDIDAKEPSFKIHSTEDKFTVKGKFELSILDKVKNDFVNIGRESYKFTIKTLYYPMTTLRAEDIKRYMINYVKL